MTVRVPHFSEVILVNSVFSLCIEAQTAEMLVVCRTLSAACQLSGDLRDPAFRATAVEVLRAWYETGIGVRLQQLATLKMDAAPPPVLVPGPPSPMPVSIVARFTDGVELPGVDALVTITATNAMVSPAGGAVRLPVFGPVTLTPAGTSSVVTIRGQFAEGPLALIPEEVVTLPAGGTLRVVESVTLAAVSAVLQTRPPVEEIDLEDVYAPTHAVLAVLDESVTVDEMTIRARSSSAAQRTVSGAADDVTITGSFRVQPVLRVEGTGSGGLASTAARADQMVCFEPPAPYLATFSVQGNGNPGSNVQLLLASGEVRGGGSVGDSGSIVLPADERACVGFEVGRAASPCKRRPAIHPTR